MTRRASLALAASLLPLALPAPPASAQTLDAELMAPFAWREIGPAAFGGRVVDVELHPTDRSTMLVASASGGLWRTHNHGTTWECIFQYEGTTSIGDVALDPTDDDVIWVGTGEANNQRSSYWGDGVYKTTDGGETWKNTGLRDSHHIGRVVIDPSDSDVVYVAALGHLYTSNSERGLYKTTDGGQRWERVLYVSPEVGVVDVALDPRNPRTVYAATYERLRRAWDFDGAGPGSAIWRSRDGGESWQRLAGGLPEGEIGRIGLALYPGDPRIVYATVSNQNEVEVEQDEAPVSFRTRFRDGQLGVRAVQRGGGAEQAGLERGDVLVSLGDVGFDSAWSGVQALAKYGGSDEELDLVILRDDQRRVLRVKVPELLRTVPEPPRTRQVGGEIYRSADGGETWEKRNESSVGGSPAYYYGQIRIDPSDPDRLYILSVPIVMSEDGGRTWSDNIAGSVHVDHHALAIDPADPRRLVLGNDGGLHFSFDRGATWKHVDNLPMAQFYAVGADMSVPYRVYGGTQDNGTWGGPSRSRQSAGIGNEEWVSVGGGDGFYAVPDWREPDTVYAESQFGALYRRDVERWTTASIRPREREQDPERYRFNWNSPILVSHHNHEIVYFGGNRLFKSFDRGDTWHVITEDLTTAAPDKVAGNVPHCTITTIAESPLDPNLVMVGTDDGLVQVSEDGGLSWANLAGRFHGTPSNWWVSRVELSRHDRDTCYAAFTGYREDDFRALVYRSQDRGKTWARISEGLPDEPVNVVREDPLRPNVLYVGTEFGAYLSVDAGATWGELGSGLPTVAVHDLVVHPRDGEVVLATHGRGFWVLDVNVVRQVTDDVLAANAHLFDVRDVVRLQRRNLFGWSGDGEFHGTNPEDGVTVAYWLGKEVKSKDIALVVRDATGATVRELDAENERGLHQVSWNLRLDPPRGEDDEGGGRRRRFQRGGRAAPDGEYEVVLTVGEETFSTRFRASGDPLLGGVTAGPEAELDFWPSWEERQARDDDD